MKASKYTRRFETHRTECEIHEEEDDRIVIVFGYMFPTALKRIADELEDMRLCADTIIEETTLFLMQPDYGLFGCTQELKDILSELAEEVNYELDFIN